MVPQDQIDVQSYPNAPTILGSGKMVSSSYIPVSEMDLLPCLVWIPGSMLRGSEDINEGKGSFPIFFPTTYTPTPIFQDIFINVIV